MNFPRILIVAAKDSLTKELEYSLKRRDCEVSFIENNRPLNTKFSTDTFDYVIYFCILSNKVEKDFSKLKTLISKGNSKTLFIFPYTQEQKLLSENNLTVKNIRNIFKNNAGTIFLGDIYDQEPRNGNNYFSDFVLKYISTQKLVAPFIKSQEFYLVSTREVVGFLVRCLFSLKVYGKRTAILGKSVTAAEALKHMRRVFGFKEVIFRADRLLTHEVDEKLVSREGKRQALRNAIQFIRRHASSQKILSRKEPGRGLLLARSLLVSRWKVKLIGFLFIFMAMPLLLLWSSFGSLFFAEKTFQGGYFSLSEKLLDSSLVSMSLARKYGSMFTELPYIGKLYLAVDKSARVFEKEIHIGWKVLTLSKKLNELFVRLTDDEPYDLSNVLSEFSLELEGLYKELGFLESEIASSSGFVLKASNILLGGADLKSLREKVLLGSKIFANLEFALGKEAPKHYVFVLQNNKVLRATGGRIESLLFLSLSNGKVTDFKVVSANEADKNLVGIVDPPTPLKNYFGQDKWYLRDANWNPNLPEAYSQIEWFIDKELDENVDGLLVVNSNAFSKMLETVGRDKEFLETLGETSQVNGYPEGGDTSISVFVGKLLKEDFNLDNRKKFKLEREWILALEQKNALIFLEDEIVKGLLQEIGWDGSLVYPPCSGNCLSDAVSLIESTVNGDSTKVEREYEFEVSFEEGLMKRKLFVFMENKSDRDYSFYTRLLALPDSGFSPLEVISNDSQIKKSPEVRGINNFKEAGVFEKIPAKKTKALLFSWEGRAEATFKQEGEYKLSFFKQAGTDFPLEVKLSFPENLSFSSIDPFTLTDRGELVYNTRSPRDFFSRILWEDK